MIVLKDKDLSTVWEEYNGLKPLLPKNQLNHIWGDRRQHFSWVNKRGHRVVHRIKELTEKLGRNDPCPCPCGSGRRFQDLLSQVR